MDTFAWFIEDIKGISPSICMHKILMEEYTPRIEHQRQLNPGMKDVMKKEVFKWLHDRFIYAISHCSWVNPVQVVPKKVGITIVKNDKDDIISTHTVIGWKLCIDY